MSVGQRVVVRIPAQYACKFQHVTHAHFQPQVLTPHTPCPSHRSRHPLTPARAHRRRPGSGLHPAQRAADLLHGAGRAGKHQMRRRAVRSDH
jgi:hypothetical protein